MPQKESNENKNIEGNSSNQKEKQKRKPFSKHWIFTFFISGWMFGIGVLVGRGTAPFEFDINGLQKELESLKTTFQNKVEHRFKINPKSFDSQDLAFFDTLKSNQKNYSTEQFKQPIKPYNDPKLIEKPPQKTDKVLSYIKPLESIVIEQIETSIKSDQIKQTTTHAPQKIKEKKNQNGKNKEEKIRDEDKNKKHDLLKSKDDKLIIKNNHDLALKDKDKKNKVKDINVKSDKLTVKKEKIDKAVKTIEEFNKDDKNNKKISIQVASLKNSKDADKYIEELKKKGFSAYKVEAEIAPNNTWYRIKIGNFRTKAEAALVLDKVKKYYNSAMITNF